MVRLIVYKSSLKYALILFLICLNGTAIHT